MRGEIVYTKRKQQINSFKNLQFENKITPTDIDGVIDFGNKYFVLFEIKHRDGDDCADMPYGQQLALERIIDNLNKPAVLFVASHNVHDTNEQVDAAACIVEKYYWLGEWHNGNGKIQLRKAIDDFKKYIAQNGATP
jgi:hypothetical protein